jgi:ACS family allantoate permease-like MFS transporter
MTILWGVVLAFILPDSPLQENFMKGKEKYIALDRVKRNMTGIENRVSPTYHRGQTFL